MSRTLYLVCYDISSPSLLRRIHKYISAYAIGGQKSFYECWMTESELMQLFGKLQHLIDPCTDSIRFFQLDPRINPIYIGTAKQQSPQPFLIL